MTDPTGVALLRPDERRDSLLALVSSLLAALLFRGLLDRPDRWRNLDEGLWAGTAAFVTAGPEGFQECLPAAGSRPLHFLLYLLADAVCGHYSLRAVAALHSLAVGVSGWALARLARWLLDVRTLRHQLLTGLAYVLLSFTLYEGENSNSEHLAGAFLLGFLLCWVRGARLDRERLRWAACALLGCAFSIKPQLAPMVLFVPAAWWLLRPGPRGDGLPGWRPFLREQAGGAAAFLLALGGVLLLAGSVDSAFATQKVGYVLDNPSFTWEHRLRVAYRRLFLHVYPVPVMLLATLAGATALLAPRAALLTPEQRAALLPLRVAGLALSGCLLATLPGFHLYSHYFLFALPVAVLVVAATVQLAVTAGRVPPRLVGLALALLLVLSGPPHYDSLWRRNDPAEVAAARWIQANTRLDERVFVWGSNPLLYLLSERVPASRYAALWYVVNDFELSALPPSDPRHLTTLLSDLERHPPALFVVPPGLAFSYDPRRYALDRFPALQALLQARYEPPVLVHGHRVYRRRGHDGF